MKGVLIAVCLILASALATVTILAACGSIFTPPVPSAANLTLWGTPCNGTFGKTHTWHLYYTTGLNPLVDVVEQGGCYYGEACYPGYDTPYWMDSNKNKWNEKTHPAIIDGNFNCAYSAA